MKLAALPCEGAPRDLGLDQGRALVGRIRARARLDLGSSVDRWMRPPGSEPLAKRVETDTRRFYPHMYERMCGLSRGSGVSQRDLAALLSRELAVTSPVGLVAVGPERGGGVARIGRRVQAADVFLRISSPGGDYRSLDLVRPGIVPALAGVNEHGLAVAASSPDADDYGGRQSDEDVSRPLSVMAKAGIARDKEVILYCSTSTRTGIVYLALKEVLGYPRVSVYDGGLIAWALDDKNPMTTNHQH